jgi:hypothetical protein
VLLLVSFGDRNRFGIVDPSSELLSPPNRIQLGSLARETRFRFFDALSQIVQTHSRLDERFPHLRHDRPPGVAAWRRATQQVAESLTDVFEHAAEWGRVSGTGRMSRI